MEKTPQGMREGVLDCEKESCPSGLGRLWTLAPSAEWLARRPPLHSSEDVHGSLRNHGEIMGADVEGLSDGCPANRHGFGFGSTQSRRAPRCGANFGTSDSDQAGGQADANRGESGMSRPSRWACCGGAGVERVAAGTGHRRLPIAWMLGNHPDRDERCASLRCRDAFACGPARR